MLTLLVLRWKTTNYKNIQFMWPFILMATYYKFTIIQIKNEF